MGELTEKRTRVLIVCFLNYWVGGIEAYINSLIPLLLEEEIEPTVMTFGNMLPSCREALCSQGVNVIEGNVLDDYSVPRSLAARFAEKKRIRDLFRRVLSEHSFDAIHVNSTIHWVQMTLMREAARAGVPVRIAHSHSAGDAHKPFARAALNSIYARSIRSNATCCLAVSPEAAANLFGNRACSGSSFTPTSGIDTAAFSLPPYVREDVRQDAPDSFVVGSVGRLSEEKNLAFLLQVFAELVKIRLSAQLWLVGDGPDRCMLEKRTEELGLGQTVVFWGERDDVPRLLQGMDCFVMPSLHEGLGLACLEAQAAGLPCVVSERVPRSVDVEGCIVRHVSLDADPRVWAAEIAAFDGRRIEGGAAFVRDAGFDIRDCAHALAREYRGLTAVDEHVADRDNGTHPKCNKHA